MSKYYHCDFCKTTIAEPVVILKGAVGTSGGILMPERLQTRDFCSKDCFWNWIEKYNPRKEEV